MKFNLFFILCVSQLPILAQSQESLPISRNELLAKVIENNKSLKISEESYNVAKADFRQTNAIYLPKITASHTAMATTNPLMAFGSKLNQEILTSNDFNPQLLNDPSQIQNYATVLEIQQPLLNADALYQRKAAKAKMEAMSFQKERTKEYLTFEVENTYMNLQLAYKGVEVLEKALLAAQENLKIARDRYAQGLMQKSDLLNVEVRLNEVKNQLQFAKSNIENTSNYLSFLMHDKALVSYVPTDSLAISNLGLNKTQIPEGRSDIQAMQLISEAYRAANKSDKLSFIPRLNAFGSYQLFSDSPFQADANGYIIGAQISWDLFNGSERFGKSQKSKAEFEKSKHEYEQYVSESELELKKTLRRLNDAENKMNLSKLALEQSSESLRIRTNRFKEGLERTMDLIASEAMYAQKQLEYYQSIYEYNYAIAYITFLTVEN